MDHGCLRKIFCFFKEDRPPLITNFQLPEVGRWKVPHVEPNLNSINIFRNFARTINPLSIDWVSDFWLGVAFEFLNLDFLLHSVAVVEAEAVSE
jgi:hypothetical protein